MGPATLRPMGRFELTVTIAAGQETVFAALTDPDRMPRWLPFTEKIESVSGPLAEAGATFTQRGAPGIRRPAGVVSSEPPTSWHLRLAGFGERADLRFELSADGHSTRLHLEATVKNGPRVIGPLLDHLGANRLDRRVWRSGLDNLKAVLEREQIVVQIGAIYSLAGGGHVRVGQVLGTDDRCVHLRLFAGRWKARPASSDALSFEASKPKDHFAIRPLDRTVRSATLAQRGSDAVLADGGFGLAHVPMTHDEFRHAEPAPVGEADLPAGSEARVAAWRQRGCAAFGDPHPPRTGAYYSVLLQAMGVEAIGFGIVKLLHSQFRGVHLSVYSNVLAERPVVLDEHALVRRPVDLGAISRALSEPLAVHHVPLTHASFASWRPEFVAMALVDPEELLPFEEWKLAKGGFF